MGIFDKRVAFKPYEYPEIIAFKEAIQDSYWTFKHWNFTSDIQDFSVKLTPVERNAVKNAMLAISQIEVSVKEFWAKIGDRFPKSEFKQVGIVYGECHIDGTEILTPHGWIDLADIEVGDEVLQYNKDGTFNITKVNYKIDKPHKGKLYKIHNRVFQTVVTPNHRIVFFNKESDFLEKTAEDFYKNSKQYLPQAAKLNGGKQSELTFIDRLRIAIQADGSRRYYNSGYGRKLRKGNGKGAEYEIKIKKERKIEQLDWILSNIGSEIVFSKAQIPSKPEYFNYTIKIDDDFDYKNFDWVNLTDKKHEWCEDFIQELAEWDGHRLPYKKDCKIKFSTTNKSVADMAQAVGIGAGYRTTFSIHVDNRSEKYNDTYIVGFTSNREKVSNNFNKEELDYDGMVRCVSVDSGVIITRYKNNTFISGQSEVRHADAYSHLLEILGFNGEFDQLLQNPVIQGRVDYLTKYLKGAADNSNQGYAMTLTLFSIFIENVSLFSQFLIIKSFRKYKNLLKDIDNVVDATLREETCHTLFGIRILQYIKEEFPEWFNDEFYAKLERACKKAYEAELKIIDWIFEKGELDFIKKDVVIEFTKDRFNQGMSDIGARPIFQIDQNKLDEVKWFNEEIYAKLTPDFFNKRPVSYSIGVQPVTAEDLF